MEEVSENETQSHPEEGSRITGTFLFHCYLNSSGGAQNCEHFTFNVNDDFTFNVNDENEVTSEEEMMEDDEISADLGADQQSASLNNIDGALFNTLTPSKRQQGLKRKFDDTTVNGSRDNPDLSQESPVGSSSRGLEIHSKEQKSCPNIFNSRALVEPEEQTYSFPQLCIDIFSVLKQIPNIICLPLKIKQLHEAAVKEEKNTLGSSVRLIEKLKNFELLLELKDICRRTYETKCCKGDCTSCKHLIFLCKKIQQLLENFAHIKKYPPGDRHN